MTPCTYCVPAASRPVPEVVKSLKSSCLLRGRPTRRRCTGDRSATTAALQGNGGRRHRLQLYIDSANQRDWDELWCSGIFYGVTTNPVLLERAGVGCDISTLRQLANSAFALGAQEVQIQAWGDTLQEVIANAEKIASFDPRTVVKVPITTEGLTAAKALTSNGARITMTGVYTAHQALSAVAVNAEYAAPYLGRICNKSTKEAGMEECVRMQRICDAAAKSDMRILVASIKDADDMAKLAEHGMDTFTFSPEVARQMLFVEETIGAAQDFEDAASRMKDVACWPID